MRMLFNTTTGWAIGDDLILRGILTVLQELTDLSCVAYYDRNPDLVLKVRPRGSTFSDVWLPGKFEWKKLFDLVVYAGTPQWCYNSWTNPLDEFVLRTGTPVIYWGVGGAGENYTMRLLQALNKRGQVKLFVARDEVAYKTGVAAGLKAYQSICPALYAYKPLRREQKYEGVTFMYPRGDSQGIISDHYNDLLAALKTLRDREVPVRLLCHTLDDYKVASELPHVEAFDIRYSRRLEDLVVWYSECKRVMSFRTHGCGLSATQDIPHVNCRLGKATTPSVWGCKTKLPTYIVDDDYTNPVEVRAIINRERARLKTLLTEALK